MRGSSYYVTVLQTELRSKAIWRKFVLQQVLLALKFQIDTAQTEKFAQKPPKVLLMANIELNNTRNKPRPAERDTFGSIECELDFLAYPGARCYFYSMLPRKRDVPMGQTSENQGVQCLGVTSCWTVPTLSYKTAVNTAGHTTNLRPWGDKSTTTGWKRRPDHLSCSMGLSSKGGPSNFVLLCNLTI